jgi:hypothetical protein
MSVTPPAFAALGVFADRKTIRLAAYMQQASEY